jgi:starch synthase (maltosyl-transferring)
MRPSTQQRVSIQRVFPEVELGRYPAKRALGEPVDVAADIVCDSHDVLAAVVRWRPEGDDVWHESPLAHDVNDRWVGTFTPDAMGRFEFTVEAWVDHFGTWRRDTLKKHAAGVMTDLDLQIGADIVDAVASNATGDDASLLVRAYETLTDTDLTDETRIDVALSDELAEVMAGADPRLHASVYRQVLPLRVDRPEAAFSSWYELFPRSASPDPTRHGTLKDVIDRLDYVESLGFDVLYLPPIHPIGTAHRKGPNNVTEAGPDDPGSPWAIGSAEGGHKAVHPELGTVDDVRALAETARARGIELALDIAFQCSPDHPYVTEHPEWFRKRPDGTIQYAENPPKKYQDIYPFDFETEDPEGLWTELKSIFEFWIDQGVKFFRVDNPHTKSFRFWEWCIDSLTREHPDLVFLSEAFTRPKVMYELAKRGFTQSYTYFTWRQEKWEIEQYYTELYRTGVVDFFRSNAWPNTPDILTEQLQFGGRPVFVQRVALAATISANYGIYGPAYELMEHVARPGAEEYVDNEKYQLRTWDLDRPDSLRPLIARLNRIRKAHPALQTDRTLAFHHIDNDQLLLFSKTSLDGDDVLLVVINLDPHWPQSGFTWLDMDALGLQPDSKFQVHDLLGDSRYLWHGQRNFVELDPHVSPVHIFQVRDLHRSERDFEYYV